MGSIIETGDDKESFTQRAASMRKSLSPGDRKYYGMNYKVIGMKIEIENLKAQMQGRDLNIYQKADALIEFNKLIDYVEELEQKIQTLNNYETC